jgi:hypothetical protein
MSTESKILDLMKVMGKEVSENFSPTLRAKLVGIDVNRGVCTMEVVPSPYEGSWSASQNYTTGHRYNRPIPYVWNAYFF